MNATILRSVPRLAAAARGPVRQAFCAHRIIVTRLLSTSPTPPTTTLPSGFPVAPPETPDSTSLVEPPFEVPLTPISDAANTASQIASANLPPEMLNAQPVTPVIDSLPTATDALPTATDALPAATDVVAAADATSTLSDTLLQPALTLLNLVHDTTGLPWWLTIAVSTLAIRTALLPVTLMTMRNSARMGALKDDIADRREAVMAAVRSGNRPAAAEHQKELQSFMRVAGVTPMKVLAGPLVQFPVFISFFVGLRRLSQADPSFATGGIAWFVDLAVKDPTFVLPVACGVTLLAMTELGGDTGQTKISPQMRMGMRAVAVLSVPMTSWFPAAVFCYWIPNNMYSMGLGAALRTRPTRRALGLDIDVSKIPGTRAARLLEATEATRRQGGVGKKVDNAAAIASYVKTSAAADGIVGKPVLFKQRPPKKIKSSSN